VTDDGDPALTAYQRYLVDIGTEYEKPVAQRPADSIDWRTPSAISSEADISTAGELVRAVNLTGADAAASPVVNGVEFTAAPFVADTTTVAGVDTLFATDSAPISGQLNRVLAGAATTLGGAEDSSFGTLPE